MNESVRACHARMAQAIEHCKALLSEGADRGAYESLSARGIKPVITDVLSTEEALMAYVERSSANLSRRAYSLGLRRDEMEE